MTRDRSPALADIHDVQVVVVEEERGGTSPAAIGFGLTLAKAAGAHLTIQSAARRLTFDSPWGGGFDDGAVEAGNRRLDALARATAVRAAGDAAQAGVVCTTEAPSVSFPEILARLIARAPLYDLTVLDADPSAFDTHRMLIEGAILESGRPVIVVPPAHTAFAARRILLAWDGSAQAARAANDALPFLRAAEAVEIVAVATEAEIHASLPGAEFAPHLARHGVRVAVTDLPRAGDVADTLRAQAGRLRADMIVMGAYHHARVREFFFGGVTRALLRNSPAPLFLSH